MLTAAAASVRAQSKSTCLTFFQSSASIHDRIVCGEALFSDPRFHFTASGLPPGNGFALGGVFEQKNEFITPYFPQSPPPVHPDIGPQKHIAFPPQGKLGSSDLKLSIVGSINQSWLATGSLILIPPLYHTGRRTDSIGVKRTCQQLLGLCTQSQLALRFEATHRSLQTVSFYGLGPASPAIKHTFHQNDTYALASVRVPLLDNKSTENLVAEAASEVLAPALPPTSDPLSVSNNFTPVTAPGLTSQPVFIHSYVGILTAPTYLSNPITNDPATNHTGPLMKRNIRFTFHNNFQYHWYAGLQTPSSSFQQLIFNGDESIQLGSNIRKLVLRSDIKNPLARLYYEVLSRACGDTNRDKSASDGLFVKPTQQCDFGKLDIRSHLTASNTGRSSTVPFYLRPTVGGSGIDSQVSLRAFPDYRFRDADSTFLQAEYTVPIYDPVGLLLFYDAGTVGPTLSSLSYAHLRQDAGTGATFRIQGNVVAQAYLAWGAGHGPTLNYNFTKSF
jgi:hypothetical protein